jgi:hypothetical protein
MGLAGFLAILGSVVAVAIGVVIVMYIVVPLAKGVGWIIRQVARFVGGEVGDALRIVGALLTQVILFPLVIANILIGRWSAAAHYGRAMQGECAALGMCLYRMAIGHPARLLCLTAVTDGIERRLPQVVAAAPTSDKPSPTRTGQFEGYRIVGSLPGGGSGGKLYIAEPDAMKRAIFERNGQTDVRNVVIKTFSLRDGSSLPQIVREGRALDAAKRLGLVLEHELTNERLYYVTRYVPGESLGLVTQRLHAMSGGDGLGKGQLQQALGYAADLLRTLDTYHKGGLWHKDVKPDNIIVDATSAHLVDFGLVTPLRSAMTLTTHGTEYFRDPELVRLALKGVKVHQVDGAKFDVYGAGAVLFSMIENSFPAHGGLSQLSRRCPEALRWIVRRAMTDYDKRYASAAAMLADLDFVRLAPDPYAVKPVDLPSMRGVEAPARAEERAVDEPAVEVVAESVRRSPEPAGAAIGAPGFGAGAVGPIGEVARGAAAGVAAVAGAGRMRPRIRVRSWWSGGYEVDPATAAGADGLRQVLPGVYVGGQLRDAIGKATAAVGINLGGAAAAPPTPGSWKARRSGLSASEQVASARARAEAARQRARQRMAGRRPARGDFRTMNAGVGLALLLFVGVCIAFVLLFLAVLQRPAVRIVRESTGSEPTLAYASGDLVAEAGDGRSGGSVKVSSASRPMPRVVVNGVEVGAAGASAETVRGLGKGQRVLVISEVQPLPAAAVAATERLRTAGFELMGNIPGNAARKEQVQEQLSLAAEAQMVRAMRDLEAPDLSREVSHWLAEGRRAEALLWFGRGEGQRSKFYIFTPALEAGDPGERPRDQVIRAIAALVSPTSR